jgi:hypothetical protein
MAQSTGKWRDADPDRFREEGIRYLIKQGRYSQLGPGDFDYLIKRLDRLDRMWRLGCAMNEQCYLSALLNTAELKPELESQEVKD